ncbi:12330_t:CDS:2, partial [Racocetra persica]
GASSHVTDASIIVSFKLHYRCIQLQHAINCDEARESDIYKVDQLQAIRWVKVNGTVVLSSLPSLIEDVKKSIFVNPDDELATEKLQQTLNALHIHNLIPIKDLLDFEKKRTEIHQQFNDDDFVEAATEIDHVENKRINDSRVIIKFLHKLQSYIHEKVQKEEAEKQIQSILDQFFQ